MTVAGTVAAVLSLDRFISNPPAGAAAFNVTVPVELVTPPVTLAGFRLTAVMNGGVTVREAL